MVETTPSSAVGNDDVVLLNSGLVFANEGNDTIRGNTNTPATVFGGLGNDSMNFTPQQAINLFVGGEGADTIVTFNAQRTTIYGGIDSTAGGGADGADSLLGGAGRDLIFGGGGNDTIQGEQPGSITIDTIAGGNGNDVFAYTGGGDDGDNAAGGGPLELVTDVDWSADRFDTAIQVTFATNTGAGTGADLNASANNAIAAAFALGGGGATVAAAQFTFAGRTYLAIDQVGLGTFVDAVDLLIDITGVTGAIATSNFI
jgi:Ca2+-binding RTX toxin-like protein